MDRPLKIYRLRIAKSFFILTLAFFCTQNFYLFSQTTAVYYKIKITKKANVKNPIVDKTVASRTENLIKSAEENLYDLYFTNEKSVFYQREKMKDDYNDKSFMTSSMFSGGNWYKNLRDSINVRQKETVGELFNIFYPLDVHKWKITNESKIIAGYTCYRAVSSKSEFNFVTNKKVESVTEAWFTPQIPVPFGPTGIDGLPGLVIVCTKNNGSITFYATEIQFDVNISIDSILNLDVGKNILISDYRKLIVDKFNSIRH